jgi:hypothetical protein
LATRDLPHALVQQERKLLARFTTTLAKLAKAEQEERLDVIRACESIARELRTVWAQMEPFNPEYVRLRRGEPSSWEALKQALQ